MNDNKMVGIEKSTVRLLDSLRKNTSEGAEYWLARELQSLFGYTKWQSFNVAIGRAKMACDSVGGKATNHFADVSKMVTLGSNTKREIGDIALSRYACYLIAMNGDPSKPEIATSQTYFAVQTRKQEIAEQLSEANDRLIIRDRVKDANKYLSGAANKAGVKNFGLFHDAGYKGLYDGLGVSDIKVKKNIPPQDELLDRIGRAELAANEFRITQTETTIRDKVIKGEEAATQTHNQVGKEVRNTIKKIGGIMPENLPAAPSIKRLDRVKKSKELPPSST